jgi:hypothetical protein
LSFDANDPPRPTPTTDPDVFCAGPLACGWRTHVDCGDARFLFARFAPAVTRDGPRYNPTLWPATPNVHPARGLGSLGGNIVELDLGQAGVVRARVELSSAVAGALAGPDRDGQRNWYIGAVELTRRFLAGDWGGLGDLASATEIDDDFLPLIAVLPRASWNKAILHRRQLAGRRITGNILGRYDLPDRREGRGDQHVPVVVIRPDFDDIPVPADGTQLWITSAGRVADCGVW